ncbi:trypsin-like peptidase domain-containing protein, partial [Campylobacter concisus]|uniref:trypsin-like peptidase domain-containing protein n=1 Tax=Campylobacter concisus TaxID=199 RepID=UPI0015E1A0A2
TLAKGAKEYKAKLIGRDLKTDLAVIKIEANALTATTFVDSPTLLDPGAVFAFVQPFLVCESSPHAIVPAPYKDEIGFTQDENFIQTHAPINPGNSSGAFVASSGSFAAINSAILPKSGGHHGTRLPTPSHPVTQFTKKLKAHGKFHPRFIVLTIHHLTGQPTELHPQKTQ